MKRSNWIPLLAAGCAAAGVAAGILTVLKKKKAAKTDPVEAVAVDVTEECCPFEEPCCPAEGCAPGEDCGCAEEAPAEETPAG